MTDGSQPLADGQHETFAKLLAKGGMSQAAAYTKAGYRGANANSAKVARKYGIPERVLWLKKEASKGDVLTQKEKRERLARVIREDSEELRDILTAIKIDNDMDPESRAIKVEHDVTVTVTDKLADLRAKKYLKR